mmetsp:Transcript_1408/g.2952  ORF Transcript_1408/g.2952 Transcript_1408/m.2952 type:complete len:238 (-) Transcript_1408:474-1187(-)
MCLSCHLNIKAKMLLDQVPELSRSHLSASTARWSHERTIPSSVTNIRPRMVKHKRRKIILERMSHQYFTSEHFSDLAPTGVQFHGVVVLGLNVGSANAGHVGTKVGYTIRNLYKGIQQNFMVPTSHRNTGESRLLTACADTHHFAIQSYVALLFVFRNWFACFDLLLFLLFRFMGRNQIIDARERLGFSLSLLFRWLRTIITIIASTLPFAFVLILTVCFRLSYLHLLATGIHKSNG